MESKRLESSNTQQELSEEQTARKHLWCLRRLLAIRRL